MSRELLDTIAPEHVSKELIALAQLLSAWASPDAAGARSGQWPKRLPAFRAAVVAGLKTGPGRVRDDVPRELVADEVSIAAAMVDHIKSTTQPTASTTSVDEDTSYGLEVSHAGARLVVQKGLPASPLVLDRIRHGVTGAPGPGRPTRDELIGLIVAERLPVEADTATKAVGRARTFGNDIHARPFKHRLLASLFLDLAWSDHRPDIQARSLDALLADGYHVLMLYYLTQLAHVPPASRVLAIDEDSIRRLCHFVDPTEAPGPFSTCDIES